MPKALKTGVSTVGGALILLPPPPTVDKTVFFNNSLVVVLGQRVASHGPPPHNAATMAQGSPDVFAYGIAVCREGHLGSCGDAATNGSADIFVN
jgi:uncharacterized Zn-binding protein involved in type VI secretion